MRDAVARLRFISICPSLDRLREEGLVSQFYKQENLLLDLWFIKSRGNQFNMSVSNKYGCSADLNWYEKLMLRVVITSLMDYAKGRPCDLGLWIYDSPPTKDICTKHAHVCRPDAEKFLLTSQNLYEPCIGLKEGTIREYMRLLG
jgi:hypothetical protein